MIESNFKNQNTNWKYILIILILAFIVGGGILIYQYRWLPSEELKLPEVKKEIKPLVVEEYIEIPLTELLKEGENKIGNVVVETIKLELLCDLNLLKNFKTTSSILKEGEYIGKMGEMTIKFIGEHFLEHPQREGGYYEVACNVENKAEVKIIGWSHGYEEFEVNAVYFAVIDKNNKLIDEDKYIEFYEKCGKVEFFHYNGKTYFLISGGVYGNRTGNTLFVLYAINRDGNMKKVGGWGCDEYNETCKPNSIMGHQQNLYLEIGDEIRDFGQDDVLKNKFPANKIIIKDSEVLFE